MLFKLLLSVLAFADGDVHNLTDDDFDKFITDNKQVLVKFFAPWCGHCKKMAPEFEGAATELKGTVPLADVDATIHKKVAEKFGVSGYPTIKWIVNGKAQEYGGGRTKDTIVEWVKSMSGPAVIETAPEKPGSKPVVILTSASKQEFFTNFADENRQEAVFYYVSGSAETITMQHADEDVQTLEKPTAETLATFFTANKVPLVGELNGDTYGSYTADESRGLIWCLFEHKENELNVAKSENMKFMSELARADGVKGKISVTYTDTVQFKQAIEGMLGVTEFPAVVLQKKAGGKQKFTFDAKKEGLDAKKVIAFVQDVYSGKITAKLKSEPVPTEQGDVKVVVGDNLMEMVFDAKKDVLFEVYAPWCGHCKKLEPEYEKLAKKVAKECPDLITIAKMDGTANDSPTDDIDWSGFPTIKYVKAGSKTVDSYEAGRTAKDMWAWIRENSTHKDEISKRLKEKYETVEAHDEL